MPNMQHGRHIQAGPLPDQSGYQVSYEQGRSRKVHSFQHPESCAELPPHAAGSYHDPDRHHELMDRLTEFLKQAKP